MQSQKVIIIECLGKYNIKSIIKNLSNFDYEILIIKRLAIEKDEKNILSSFQLPYNLKKIIIFEYILGPNELDHIEDHLNYLFKIPFGCEIVNINYRLDKYKHLTEYKYKATKKKNLKSKKIYYYELKNFLDKNIIYESYKINDIESSIFSLINETIIKPNESFYTDKDNKKYLLIEEKY